MIYISENDCLMDLDEAAWREVVNSRGGCSCHISPPCNSCVEPISEDELNAVCYTMQPVQPSIKHLPSDDTEGGAA